MQIIDFQAARQRAELERRGRLHVLSQPEAEGEKVLPLSDRLGRWAAAHVSTLFPEPDPGPSAA